MSRPPSMVAMTGAIAEALRDHLLRADGQEDVCFATYRVSTGAKQTTALITEVILPEYGERDVHGGASFTGRYVTRAAACAAAQGAGLMVLHSHPLGRDWQGMSAPDEDTERSYAYLAHELTGLPLIGMTLAGRDGCWSARSWSAEGTVTWASAVRIVDSTLTMSFNDELRPKQLTAASQVRTVSAWGEELHSSIARLRILVVGLGSVGLDVALRLAATGVAEIGLMDFDRVENLNLDRLVGATPLDALLRRRKVDVAARLLRRAATAPDFTATTHVVSICEPDGLAAALDYDFIISCVDRPWARGVLNTIAYSDLIPVIDGGIHIDAFDDGGMRGATWRTHLLRPGRPCLACNGQLDPALVAVDREGLLDDPTYIAQAGLAARSRQNVAALSASVSAAMLALFVSHVARPGGLGEPGPMRFHLATHSCELVRCTSSAHCAFEAATGHGDARPDLTGHHLAAEHARSPVAAPLITRVIGGLGRLVDRIQAGLDDRARRRLRGDHQI